MVQARISEVTSMNWWTRVKNSIKGIVVGCIFFVISFAVLFWNEGRAVKTAQSLREGASVVITVPAEQINSGNEGALVHITGMATTQNTLTDPVFTVSLQGIKLKRKVEMFQWKEEQKKEERKKIGGGTETETTYRYFTTWSGSLINSDQFRDGAQHRNPSSMPYLSQEFKANDVRLGAFRLSASLIDRISNYKPYPVTQALWNNLTPGLQGQCQVYDSYLYMGRTPARPMVGDVRITFEVVEPGDISVIARQTGATFSPYPTHAGRSLELLRVGIYSAEEIFQSELRQNALITWVLRFVGFFIMLFGLLLILQPLSVIADILPLLGSLVGIGTFFCSFVIAISLSFITIAIAWIVYRPVLGIILLLIGIGSLAGLKKAKKKQSRAR